jgi:cholesterol 7-dehydrogenase
MQSKDSLFRHIFIGLLAIGIPLVLYITRHMTYQEPFWQFWSENYDQVPHASTIAVTSATIICFGWIYHMLSRELNVKYALPHPKRFARVAAVRKAGKIPLPYPTGWYKLMRAEELKVGDVKFMEFFGEHYVLFRGENGRAALLDAYCPHLGANLAASGRVVGNCIECPFHGWQFQDDGKCAHIPYVDKVPEVAKTTAYPVKEDNGMIMVYFDMAEKYDSISWEPPVIDEISSGKYIFHGGFENNVECHIQEIPENGSDVAHLGVLHVPFVVAWIPFLSHRWTAQWTAGEEPTEHISNIRLTQAIMFMKWEIPFTNVITRIRQVGPGLVFLDIHTGVGHMVVTETVTPVAPLHQKVTHCVYAPAGFFNRIVAQVLLRAFCEQFCRDVVIWNNKTYISKPMIVKNDGNILGFRRWYAKFYPPEDQVKKKPDLSW